MKLSESFEKTGEWLFERRGSFPFLIVPLVFMALWDAELIGRVWGARAESIWESFCIAVSFSGLLVRAVTIGWIGEGTSGRNTKGQVADSLNTRGVYSIVRHPLYLGNFLIIFGMILFIQVWWLAVFYVLLFWLFYERIMFAEETYLEKKFGDSFRAWAQEAPAFFPHFGMWKNPSAPFSFRRVLKREYSTFFGIIVGFVVLKFLGELMGERKLEFRFSWLVFLGIGLAVYLSLRTIRKNTKWLNSD